MIYIRMEMWPHGDKGKAYLLGEGMIANVGGDDERGDYDVRLLKSERYAKTPGVWKRGKVMQFPRLRLGPWDLLLRALRACIADRNPEPQ